MGEKEHNPLLIVIAGPNGSGKTSVTSRLLKHEWMEDAVYINPDIIAKEVFGDWNSKEAVLNAANYCAEWRERCLLEKKSLIFETVMSADEIMRIYKLGRLTPNQWMQEAVGANFSTTPILNAVDAILKKK